MVATPKALVSLVAEEGVNATSELVDAKVTTAPLTSVPLASLSVALAVIGMPNVTVVEESVKVSVGVPVVVSPPLPPPVSAVSGLPPQAIRQQIKNRERSSHSGWKNFDLLASIIITLLLNREYIMLLCLEFLPEILLVFNVFLLYPLLLL